MHDVVVNVEGWSFRPVTQAAFRWIEESLGTGDPWFWQDGALIAEQGHESELWRRLIRAGLRLVLES